MVLAQNLELVVMGSRPVLSHALPFRLCSIVLGNSDSFPIHGVREPTVDTWSFLVRGRRMRVTYESHEPTGDYFLGVGETGAPA